MAKRIGLVALLFLGFVAAPALRADEATGQPFVVVVGIDKYQDPQIKPRKHAEADAKAFYDLFASKDHLGVAKDHIKLLLGSGKDGDQATKDNILKALQWIEKGAKKNDLVVFAMFGNGAPLGERTCYFGVDSTFKNRAKDAVASGDIEHIVDRIKSERFVAMLDVNFMGFDIGKEKAPDLNTQKFYQEIRGQDDESKDTPPSRVIFLANLGTKPSIDLEKHGIFAQVMLDGLRGKADAEGYEADGNVMATEMAKYLKKALPDLAREFGKTKEQKEQKPIIYDGQTTDFVIGFSPEAHVKSLERLKKFDNLAQEQKLDKKLAEEGHAFLARMPKLEAQRSLRKAYQQFVDGKLDLAGLNAERKDILETTKLSDRDALKFATTVMNAVNLVRKEYYKEVTKGPLVENAVTGLYKHIEENVPSDLKERIAKVKEMKDVDLLRLLTDARQQLGKREDLDKGSDITFALNGMCAKLDRHTGYIPPDVVKRFRQDTAGKFSGIGVQIRKNEVRDELQVITPIYGSPAYKKGLKANDIITTIISEVDPETGREYDEPKTTPTKGMTTEEAVKLILGKPGTRIKLLVDREGEKKPLEFTIIRGTVEVESVLGFKRTQKDTWNYVIDPDNKICYVRLTQFSDNTYGELEKVMKKLAKEGVKGFILDLRFNPGGLLDSSIKIADLFIDDGLIVTVRKRDGSEISYVGQSAGSYTAFPMVCLVNGFSASASEIVSACLQDHGRAIIMGSRSFGKGSVQTINRFSTNTANDSVLKLTTATFWRPSGRNLNRASTPGKDTDEWGVTPNKGFEIKLTTKELNDLSDHQRETEIIRGSPSLSDTAGSDFHDRQLDMALEYLRGQIKTASRKDTRDVENR
jgi:carboxyl-terminal processing protease